MQDISEFTFEPMPKSNIAILKKNCLASYIFHIIIIYRKEDVLGVVFPVNLLDIVFLLLLYLTYRILYNVSCIYTCIHITYYISTCNNNYTLVGAVMCNVSVWPSMHRVINV